MGLACLGLSSDDSLLESCTLPVRSAGIVLKFAQDSFTARDPEHLTYGQRLKDVWLVTV